MARAMQDMMGRALRDMRRKVRPNYAPAGGPFKAVHGFHANATWVIRGFYLIGLIFSYGLIAVISHKSPDSADFLWPVMWLNIGGLRHYMVALPITLFALNCAVVAWPGRRITRALFALFCLFSAAIDNSFGAINHGWHIWIWISVMMIFLPSGQVGARDVARDGARDVGERARKLTTLSVMVYIQGMLLLFYSMAGTLKLIAGIKALAAGEMGNFSSLGFASLLADRMVQGRGVTIAGDFFIAHPMIAYPLFLGLIAVQTLAFPAAFFPPLHRALGLVLIGFHLGTGLLMDIYFPAHVAWLALFLVCSPFAARRAPAI